MILGPAAALTTDFMALIDSPYERDVFLIEHEAVDPLVRKPLEAACVRSSGRMSPARPPQAAHRQPESIRAPSPRARIGDSG